MKDVTDLFAALAANEPTSDRLAIIDEIVETMQPRTPGDRIIVFSWSPKWGMCAECGLPAAFYVPHIFGYNVGPVDDRHKRCAVCAANDAANGAVVTRIESFDMDIPVTYYWQVRVPALSSTRLVWDGSDEREARRIAKSRPGSTLVREDWQAGVMIGSQVVEP